METGQIVRRDEKQQLLLPAGRYSGRICKESIKMDSNIGEKICTRCHIRKPLMEFVRRAKYKSGYTARCKACKNEIEKGYQRIMAVCKRCGKRKQISEFATNRVCLVCKNVREIPETKTCSLCHIEKPLGDFYLSEAGKYGRDSRCSNCEREYGRLYMQRSRQERPDEIREIQRKSIEKNRPAINLRNNVYYYENRKMCLEKAAEYREANRETINAWHRQHYAENKEQKAEQDRIYNETHRVEVSKRRRKYRNAHRVETRMRNRMRKLRLRFSNADYTQRDWLDCLIYWKDRCAICGNGASDDRYICADHWIPLSKGRVTHKLNILPLCHGINGCNNQKHDKDGANWLIKKLGQDKGSQQTIFYHVFFRGTGCKLFARYRQKSGGMEIQTTI